MTAAVCPCAARRASSWAPGIELGTVAGAALDVVQGIELGAVVKIERSTMAR